jgi:hypothetical protein
MITKLLRLAAAAAGLGRSHAETNHARRPEARGHAPSDDGSPGSGLARHVPTVHAALSEAKSHGFTPALVMTFRWHGGDQDEYFVVLHAQATGAVITLETLGGTLINGGALHYNWRDGRPEYGGHVLPVSTILEPHLFSRALAYDLEDAAKSGSFVTPWQNPPALQLTHAGDVTAPGYKDADMPRLTLERIPLLTPCAGETVRVVAEKYAGLVRALPPTGHAR